jgi:uncharacterized OsmC-like protein
MAQRLLRYRQTGLYACDTEEKMPMSATVADKPATAMTGCLAPIDKGGLEGLIAKGKENPKAVKTLKCRTIAEGRFRHLNMIRTLPAHVIDEPPVLLGDDTAPNPSEAALAALGSCLAVGIHANAVARNITVRSLELELEADINITAVWGTGDTSPKPVGFEAVRVKVHLDADAPRADLDALIAHATTWSPVANTFTKPVALAVESA